jgi:hypothetical protein
MQWSLEELGMTMLVLLVGWFGCTAIQEIWMQVACYRGISCPDVSEKRSVQMKEIAEVYGNGFLQIAGGIGALLLFFHAVDGQGMIGMVLRYYMTGICGS